MARQIKLFPAEEMQEDIISMENIEAPTKKVNLEDKNSLFTPIVQEEPKQNIEPFDVAVNGKIGGVFSKELGDVFKLSKDKVKQKEEAQEPKPVREFVQEEDPVISAESQKDAQLDSPILEQAAETTAQTQERQKYINPTDTKIA